MMQRKFLERKIERKDKGNYLDGKICLLWPLILSLIHFYPAPNLQGLPGEAPAGVISGISKWAEMTTFVLGLQTSPSSIPIVESS